MSQTVVFYDGNCRMCVGVTGWLSRIDTKKQFRLEPYQHTDLLKEYPQLNSKQLEKQIHVITENGTVLRGADAMMEIWRKTGHWSSFIAAVFKCPPFIWFTRPIYNLVARYRRSIYPNR